MLGAFRQEGLQKDWVSSLCDLLQESFSAHVLHARVSVYLPAQKQCPLGESYPAPEYRPWRQVYKGCPGSSGLKNTPANEETRVRSLGGEDPLEEEMATHSSVLA